MTSPQWPQKSSGRRVAGALSTNNRARCCNSSTVYGTGAPKNLANQLAVSKPKPLLKSPAEVARPADSTSTHFYHSARASSNRPIFVAIYPLAKDCARRAYTMIPRSCADRPRRYIEAIGCFFFLLQARSVEWKHGRSVRNSYTTFLEQSGASLCLWKRMYNRDALKTMVHTRMSVKYYSPAQNMHLI